ncbi:DUF3732 domain-containing protein [Cellulosimicrobium arenosum]|uniref:DUF3732 domain-containing protein n=1 Tax=Cellulosimicrobium arenosum TaxID=2708133 RepID=A0A927IZA0_9MICO|nr:DUF3732 domain-containing protein [Cellulosimicrobium arenosum]
MQLLAIVLYNADGRTRRLDFEPGALNIVTGESQAGKSALLTIVEYCLGRSTMMVPVGPIANTVAWYSTLWQLDDGGRAFVARPAPAPGKASTSGAMLEFGATLDAPPLSSLEVNIESRALREQMGRRIGIEENLSEPPVGSLRHPLEANIGHAALLCLQSQNEVASANTLFHRQGEPGIDQALRDTIPYFLGAVAHDEALKRAQLRDAKRNLTRLSNELERAENAALTIDVELNALLAEARAVGLVGEVDVAGRSDIVRILQGARVAQPQVAALADTEAQDRRLELQVTRDQVRAELRRVLDDRALLIHQEQAETGASASLRQQRDRLTVLARLPGFGDSSPSSVASAPLDTDTCPVCGHELEEPDPTAAALQIGLSELRAQVEVLTGARPAHRRAVADLDTRAAELRGEIRTADDALAHLERAYEMDAEANVDSRDFTRGRIDATLTRANLTDETQLEVLRQQLDRARMTVEALESDLDADNDREQLTSRLVAVGRDISRYAAQLQLEHSGDSVRLDLARLTVVTDTPTGPAPLFRIGSAANWIGYHLATHLALHRFLVEQNRPVPRLLMLDQPTQAHYPAEADNATGAPEDDADRVAVRRMFELMRDVVAELAPKFQMIVCDHADLPESWFQTAVRYRWRAGVKLIPADWINEG